MRRDLSVSVHFVREVLRSCNDHGIDAAALLRRNRISPRLIQEDNARIAIERFANLQVSAMVAMQDEALGYASRRMPIGTWSMMCHAVIGSETLGQALSRYCRFYQLFEFGQQPLFEAGPETSAIRMTNMEPGVATENYLSELAMFNAYRFACWLVEESLPVSSINFSYPPVAKLPEYRNMFLANPVVFEQDQTSIVISNKLLDKRVTQDQKTLRHFLRHPVLMLLTQRFDQSSWTSRVRDRLSRQMEDMPELSGVADLLEVHPQTLRRRLSAEGTSFKEIKNQVRRDTALYLLGKHGLSIEEIAHRSGFSEASAFIRAFKGWTGVTPYSYRKGL
jgi:AraC-like DNA-binding protein